MTLQYSHKNNPRVIIIQKLYGKFFNKDEDFIDKACYLSEGSVSRALQILNGVGSDTITEISHLLGVKALIDRNILEKTTDKWLRIGRKQDKDPIYSILDFFIFWISKCLRDIA